MKKFMLIAALIVAALNVNAQDNDFKNEIGISYGFGANSDIISTFAKAFNFGSSDQSGYWGPVAVEYFHKINPVVGIGGVAAIAGCKWENSNGLYKNAKSTYFTVMPAVKFSWLRKNHFGMYSKLAAGLTYQHATSDNKNDNSTNFAFQVSALGMEFGSQVRGFVELGVGEQGIVLAGLRYKF